MQTVGTGDRARGPVESAGQNIPAPKWASDDRTIRSGLFPDPAMTITELFRSLNAPLRNHVWSWGAATPDGSKVYLRVWKHEIECGRYVKLVKGDQQKLGHRERKQHARLIGEGAEVYCILCMHEPKRAGKRGRIRSFCREPIPCRLIQRHGAEYLELLR